jgi:Salmonella virulence plasmid 65kDa B protein
MLSGDQNANAGQYWSKASQLFLAGLGFPKFSAAFAIPTAFSASLSCFGPQHRPRHNGGSRSAEFDIGRSTTSPSTTRGVPTYDEAYKVDRVASYVFTRSDVSDLAATPTRAASDRLELVVLQDIGDPFAPRRRYLAHACRAGTEGTNAGVKWRRRLGSRDAHWRIIASDNINCFFESSRRNRQIYHFK